MGSWRGRSSLANGGSTHIRRADSLSQREPQGIWGAQHGRGDQFRSAVNSLKQIAEFGGLVDMVATTVTRTALILLLTCSGASAWAVQQQSAQSKETELPQGIAPADVARYRADDQRLRASDPEASDCTNTPAALGQTERSVLTHEEGCSDAGPPVLFHMDGWVGTGYYGQGPEVHLNMRGNAFSWDPDTYSVHRYWGDASTEGEASGSSIHGHFNADIDWVSEFLGAPSNWFSGNLAIYIRGPAGTPYSFERTDTGVVSVAAPDGCTDQGPSVWARWNQTDAGGGLWCGTESNDVNDSYGASGTTSGTPCFFDEYPGVEYHRVHYGHTSAYTWENNGAQEDRRAICHVDVDMNASAYINRGEPPVADIESADTTFVLVGVPAICTSASYDPDGGAIEHHWTAESAAETHGESEPEFRSRWDSAGTFLVTLRVLDCDGRSGHDQTTVVVREHACDGDFVVSLNESHGDRYSARQKFRVLGFFFGNVPCCEYRQYRRDLTTVAGKPAPRDALDVLFGPSMKEDGTTFSALGLDGCDRRGRYGHRSDEPNCAADRYTPEPRATGYDYFCSDEAARTFSGANPWLWRVEFQARLARVSSDEFGCGEDEEESKASWEVCREWTGTQSVPCALPISAQAYTVLGRKLITLAAPSMGGETRLGFIFTDTGSDLGVSVVGETTRSPQDYRMRRAMGVSLELDGIKRTGHDGTVAPGANWTAVFSFERPQKLPKYVHVRVGGLDEHIEFDQALEPETSSRGGVPGHVAEFSTSREVPSLESAREVSVRCFRNPARGAAEFRCSVPPQEDCTLRIYRPDGRLVATQQFRSGSAAAQLVTWDGRDARGSLVAPGVYLAKLGVGTSGAATKFLYFH